MAKPYAGITNFDGLAFVKGLYVGPDGSEVQLINSSGNIVSTGTGTFSTLTVNGTATITTSLFIGKATTSPVFLEVNNNSLAAGDAYILIDCDGTGVPILYWERPSSQNFGAGIHTDGTWRLSATSSGLGTNSRLIIDSNGAFTIGTSSGTQTHTVNGSGIRGNAGATSAFLYDVNGSTALVRLQGGSSGGTDPRLDIYGSSHASRANQLEYYQGATQVLDIDSSGAFTIGASGGTQTHSINGNISLSGTSVIGGSSLDSAAILRIGSTNPLTGTSQHGVREVHAITSAGTSQGISFISDITTAASSFTCSLVGGFYFSNSTKGSGSTITRQFAFAGAMPTQGSSNAFLTDNFSYSGNWFINSTSTNPSQLGGALTTQAGSQASPTLKTSGILYRGAPATVSNSSTNETNLWTYSMPASVLGTNGDSLVLESGGSFAANGNTKTIKLYVGSTAVTVHSATTNNQTWYVRYNAIRLNTTQYRGIGTIQYGTTVAQFDATITGSGWSSSQTVKITGQGTSDSDITAKFFAVKFEPAAP